eukprot:TRINITY_DN5536_c0_g1_i1.p2 TRINITY_DN5536_c0_g1~~TRINITY_DN5536_c0_g1_i1.p2  ORF type:complete len:158 (-),score=17.40 TRINITY_DN5536_c0_g1_i1:402-875(-)
MTDTDALPTYKDVVAAKQRIESYVHRTPVMVCDTLNSMAGKNIFFKCENLQKVGAFKIRGAMNALLSLDLEPLRECGVVTHSSGNHAQALALAAKILGLPAHIVMPQDAPECKVRAVRDSYDATVTMCEPTTAAREAMCEKIQKETECVGRTRYHGY